MTFINNNIDRETHVQAKNRTQSEGGEGDLMGAPPSLNPFRGYSFNSTL